MSLRFSHETLAQRVVFATGTAEEALAGEVARLDARRVMVIASEQEAGRAARAISGLPVAVRHTEVAMHVPSDVAARARTSAEEHAVDVVVAIGGGSATGLAKAVALTTALPVVAVPTTYAGSEVTPVWGLTEGGAKTTGVDQQVLPRAVVYDAALTLTLPVRASVASGMNALAHGVDALWAPGADPVNATLATEGVRTLAGALPGLVGDPVDLAVRERALLGAYLTAAAFASAGSGLHHRICHVLGGRHGLPHAETHAVVLPHVLALNAPYAPAAERRLATSFGAATAHDGLEALRRRVAAPRALRELGLDEAQVDGAAEAVLAAAPPDNPAPLSVDGLRDLLRRAWAGVDPRDA